ncbi:hypothetical protein [Ferirhizobium litorale]|uniref:Uncharacterized protein n=1 Tax=Ferirhizobium litorale TaxID=2927786 RepID=A0AAE3QB32_9HYPH|nr:hypothetical protein [Fererhizobium litorale]MDI7921745.1 hypothetical protein [Fererhizobium litorale]
MTMIEPPSNLSRSEKKAFRKHAKTLANAGVDVSLRADLIADFVRSDSRLQALREAEKAVEPASKLAASRATTTASAERRRLHELLYRGASTAPRTRAERVKKAIAASAGEIDKTEAHEAWRDVFWWRPRGKPKPTAQDWERVRANYPNPGMAPLVWWCAEEEAAWKGLVKASNGNPTREAVEALRARIGGFASDWLAPSAVNSQLPKGSCL